MTLPVMADTRTSAIINAPMTSIDVTEWVFTLTDSEYRACSKDHVSAGVSRAPDGRRMSINVEHVGRLIVQRYVEDKAERDHCRLLSTSTTFGPSINDRGSAEVIWEFYLERIDAETTRFTNYVRSTATEGWSEELKREGVTLEQAQERNQAVVSAHNEEETPLFAADIERKARQGRWAKAK